jgi:hypothetical protein
VSKNLHPLNFAICYLHAFLYTVHTLIKAWVFLFVTGSNDQKGRKAHIITGPRPAVNNHSGASKRLNSEFVEFETSSIEYCFQYIEFE